MSAPGYEPLKHVAELEAEVGRLRGERDQYHVALKGILGAIVDSGLEIRDHIFEYAVAVRFITKERDLARAVIEQIQEIAQNHGDGAEDAHPLEKAMNRIEGIASGEAHR